MPGIKIRLEGVEELERELRRLNSIRFDAVVEAQAVNMADRAAASHNPNQGGTPYDSGELIQSIGKTGKGSEAEIGYAKEYAPHVEYGHRQIPGTYVPDIGKRLKADYVEGRHFLKNNVDIQRDIYRQDLLREIKKENRT